MFVFPTLVGRSHLDCHVGALFHSIQANYQSVKASMPPAEAAVGTNVFKAVVAKFKNASESEKKVWNSGPESCRLSGCALFLPC